MIDTANSPFLPHRPPGMPCLTACDLKKELPNFSSSDSLLMSSTFPGQLPLASRLKWKGRLFLSAKVQNVSRLKSFQGKILKNYMGLQKQSIFWQFCPVKAKSTLGANHHFWVKTRFGTLVKSSNIWANQVRPRAILATKNDKNKNKIK